MQKLTKYIFIVFGYINYSFKYIMNNRYIMCQNCISVSDKIFIIAQVILLYNNIVQITHVVMFWGPTNER